MANELNLSDFDLLNRRTMVARLVDKFGGQVGLADKIEKLFNEADRHTQLGIVKMLVGGVLRLGMDDADLDATTDDLRALEREIAGMHAAGIEIGDDATDEDEDG
ncbi:MAG: hypothetical protein ACOY3P_20125 [Planctomycetota bacterium]